MTPEKEEELKTQGITVAARDVLCVPMFHLGAFASRPISGNFPESKTFISIVGLVGYRPANFPIDCETPPEDALSIPYKVFTIPLEEVDILIYALKCAELDAKHINAMTQNN